MRKGFTLIELLIVIAIIGLLATLAIVSLTTAQQKARDTKRVADLKQLQNAVELYFSQSGTNKYPNNAGVALTDWVGPTVATSLEAKIGSYITNMPIDPSNTGTKVYTYAVLNSTYDQYVLKAELEATNAALTGDDDTATYVVGVAASEYTGVDSLAADATTASLDCATEAGATWSYCVSE